MSLDALKIRHTLIQAIIDALRLEGQEPVNQTREAMSGYMEGTISFVELLEVVRGQVSQDDNAGL